MNHKTGGTRRRLGRSRRATALAAPAAALAGAALLAACGGAAHSTESGQATAKQAAAFAQCMRAHGLAGFYPANPQSASSPVVDVYGNAFTGVGSPSPQLQSATASCEHLLPGAGQVTPPTKQQIDSLVNSAQCMHARGFPSYPEPDVQNGVLRMQPLPSSVDTSSPQFQSAAKVCHAQL
jgi:hypothetical protein